MPRSEHGADRRTSPPTLVTCAAFIAVAVALIMGSPASAAQVTLAWDANTEPDLAGYRVHYGTASGDYTDVVDAGLSTTVTVDGLDEGVSYYFAATAYDTAGDESGYSNEAVHLAGAGGPVLFSDDFSDGDRSGDPDWTQWSGGWSVTKGDQYAAAADLANRTLVTDPAVTGFTAGSFEVRVKMTSKFQTMANAYLYFGWQDPGHYRYVRLKKSGVTIGQAGDDPPEIRGVKARVRKRLRTNRWYRVRVDIAETGSVAVYLNDAAEPVATYDFAASSSGRLGLCSKQAKVLFDDVVVRGVAPLF